MSNSPSVAADPPSSPLSPTTSTEGDSGWSNLSFINNDEWNSNTNPFVEVSKVAFIEESSLLNPLRGLDCMSCGRTSAPQPAIAGQQTGPSVQFAVGPGTVVIRPGRDSKNMKSRRRRHETRCRAYIRRLIEYARGVNLKRYWPRQKKVVKPPIPPGCCCGMGMKLRCFEGNRGGNPYHLLESSSRPDKDSATEKQEELHFFDDNGGYVSVVVEKNLVAIDLTQLLAVKNRVKKDYCWCIAEHYLDLGIERVLEDHEDVLSVHRQTEEAAKKYIFRRFPFKYDFFTKPEDFFPPDMIDLKTYLPGYLYPEKHPEQLERVLTSNSQLPVIFSQVNLRQGPYRNLWVKTFLLLRDGKVYMSAKVRVVAKFLRAWRDSAAAGYKPLEGEGEGGATAEREDGLEQYVGTGGGANEELEMLADLKEYEIYTSLNAKNHLKGPTEFGVVLRKTNEEDFADPVVLSFDKERDRICWVTAMRLAKYGKQLRENYRAFKNKQDALSSHGSSGTNESVRSRVAMDFTGKVGRIVDDPVEAKEIAASEGAASRKRLGARVEFSRSKVLQDAVLQVQPHHSQPWYHTDLSRDEAVALIRAHATGDGVFVVRASKSLPGGDVLSVGSQKKVIHIPIMVYKVQPDDDSDEAPDTICYSIDRGITRFYDVNQLIEFYRLNKGTLPKRLTDHIEKVQPKQPKQTVTTAIISKDDSSGSD